MYILDKKIYIIQDNTKNIYAYDIIFGTQIKFNKIMYFESENDIFIICNEIWIMEKFMERYCVHIYNLNNKYRRTIKLLTEIRVNKIFCINNKRYMFCPNALYQIEKSIS